MLEAFRILTSSADNRAPDENPTSLSSRHRQAGEGFDLGSLTIFSSLPDDKHHLTEDGLVDFELILVASSYFLL